ncbi:universal stress protein [Jejuia pallidilutea]|jgi:nucleotide-binding universal stress UspA family protein|uniref:Putative universal stress protein UspA n=1 Tax=Jejuia pallidilutea TaxID=504487 RepID=A0A090VXL0_9FLAO|nr:universal stress protein [Jejuia pallidilutea]GAL68713.1 putative universal stress protein UspA [Jejuia pallidilutea]GAL72864.1 putative universal stress protein UspA [Jejuia pallidilutea]GAL90300.1 putative universal stress protein UspA [Jejuia pallidilutea]
MKTILYATDCTVNDIASLKYAYRFSTIMKADLHIVHVYEFPPIANATLHAPELLKKRMHIEKTKLVENFCKVNLKHEFQQKPVTTHVIESGSVSESIQRLSNVLMPDLVIIGMKDHHSTREFFSGNIANALLDTIEMPLLIVPNGMIYNTISTIVYATDFEEYDILSLQKLAEIASPFSALIEVIHVYKTDERPAKVLMEAFKKRLLQKTSYPEITFKTIASTNIKSGLLSIVNWENANVLAMLERKHDWNLANLFHKDLVKEMESAISIPLLVFNKSSIESKKIFVPTNEPIFAY